MPGPGRDGPCLGHAARHQSPVRGPDIFECRPHIQRAPVGAAIGVGRKPSARPVRNERDGDSAFGGFQGQFTLRALVSQTVWFCTAGMARQGSTYAMRRNFSLPAFWLKARRRYGLIRDATAREPGDGSSIKLLTRLDRSASVRCCERNFLPTKSLISISKPMR